MEVPYLLFSDNTSAGARTTGFASEQSSDDEYATNPFSAFDDDDLSISQGFGELDGRSVDRVPLFCKHYSRRIFSRHECDPWPVAPLMLSRDRRSIYDKSGRVIWSKKSHSKATAPDLRGRCFHIKAEPNWHYRILGILGYGTYSTVYKVEKWGYASKVSIVSKSLR